MQVSSTAPLLPRMSRVEPVHQRGVRTTSGTSDVHEVASNPNAEAPQVGSSDYDARDVEMPTDET